MDVMGNRVVKANLFLAKKNHFPKKNRRKDEDREKREERVRAEADKKVFHTAV